MITISSAYAIVPKLLSSSTLSSPPSPVSIGEKMAFRDNTADTDLDSPPKEAIFFRLTSIDQIHLTVKDSIFFSLDIHLIEL